MKKIVTSLVVFGIMLSTSGCATMWNYNRVKQNMVKERIMTRGSVEQKQAVISGIRPSTALAIIPTQDAKGAYIALDWFSLPSFMETASEAPASTIGSIIVDSALVGLAVIAVQQAGGSNSKSDSNTQSSGRDSTVIAISGDGNTVNHSGDTTTTASP